MLLLFPRMYCGPHNYSYEYIFLTFIHIMMIYMHLTQLKCKNFKCHKSTYCWLVWNTGNILRYSTNWIFGLRILKYLKGAVIFAPCPLVTFTTMVIPTPLEITLAYLTGSSPLTPIVQQWLNFNHCCFGYVAIRRRCDMNFWKFSDK
jgi:hypothetical protein